MVASDYGLEHIGSKLQVANEARQDGNPTIKLGEKLDNLTSHPGAGSNARSSRSEMRLMSEYWALGDDYFL